MNSPNHPLDRLLRCARQAAIPTQPIPALSDARMTRVLAEWREQTAASESGALLALWRWGVASAFGVALMILTASLVALPNEDAEGDPYVLTDRTISLAVHSAWLP